VKSSVAVESVSEGVMRIAYLPSQARDATTSVATPISRAGCRTRANRNHTPSDLFTLWM